MEAVFVIVAIPIVVLTLIIVIGTIIRFVKSFKYIYEPEKHSRWSTVHYKITPVLISVICPVAGFVIAEGCGTSKKYDDLICT
ncbi:MAG: hypothetical protein ACI94Y_003144 [Maribacter sp.]|jgi:hypothetical protein